MKYWPIKFDGVQVNKDEPIWKQILWVSVYEWDEYPYGMTIRILGFDFNFYLGGYE